MGQPADVDARVLADTLAGAGPAGLRREAPPPGSPALSQLRATYSGLVGDGRVTVMDFYDPAAVTTALGEPVPSGGDVVVLRRRNVAVLFDGPDAAVPSLKAALADAPLRG